ncbi:hypothetical protein [Chryseobacterium aquifrigidense]|uniref:Uncharacterized protein n=1 Tax=Chryseobacterium aquifrigidense TaxID=558021 RepID=A0A543E9Q5_9FLAO|nr:hypothetical protein [Chryseobacterium aquifrigidense]TQM18298.1 hypothetical protein FB551_4079 [Chryseobacterium aquifrigidense]
MKVNELKIDQQIIINGFTYSYKGQNKVRMKGFWAQKIVFKGVDVVGEKLFDLSVGTRELKESGKSYELK